MEMLEPFHRVISVAVEYGLITALAIAAILAVI